MSGKSGEGNPKKPKLDPNEIHKQDPGAMRDAADNGQPIPPKRKAGPKGKPDQALAEIANSPSFDVRYNEFNCRFFVNGEPLEKEIHAYDLSAQLNRKNIKVSMELAQAALKRAGRMHAFNPVVEELRRLRWDQLNRLETVFETYFGALGDPDYLGRVGPWFFIGHVARLLEPGSRQDSMLVLEGGEGLGKTQFCRLLASGEEYYRENLPDLHTADAKEALIGKRVVEMCELVALNSARSQETFKAFASSPTDNVRLPYGERSQAHPRTASIVGTTNSDKYLSSEHGNRRVWGVPVNDIDLAGLERDIKQLLAEAVMRYDLGEKWWPDRNEQALVFNPEQEGRLENDPYVEAIRSTYASDLMLSNRPDYWTAREVFDEVQGRSKGVMEAKDWPKLARKMWPAAMRKAGFKPVMGLVGKQATATAQRGSVGLWVFDPSVDPNSQYVDPAYGKLHLKH